MTDDGNHHDGVAGDGIFGARLTLDGKSIQYYIVAQNDSAAVLSPPRAEFEFYSIQPLLKPGDIVVNEILTGSSPWIEVLNNTAEPLNVEGLSLSATKMSYGQWPLPDSIVRPGKYLVVYPDYMPDNSSNSASWPLSMSGGSIFLTDSLGTLLDSVTYSSQVSGKTTGRYPNGYGPMTFMPPTPGQYNRTGTTPVSGFGLYPNPARGTATIEMVNPQGPARVDIYNSMGMIVSENQFSTGLSTMESMAVQTDISELSAGLYMVKLTCNGNSTIKKLIIY